MLSLILGGMVHAAVTVKPVNVSANTGIEIEDSVVHVAALYSPTYTAISGGFIDPLLSLPDLSYGLSNESDGSRSNMLVFDVATDQAPTPGLGQQLGLVIEASGTSGVTTVPIAAAGYADIGYTSAGLPSCGASGASCYSESGGYYLAIPFTAERVLRVGFYPKDICVIGVANSPNGCAGGVVSGTGYPITMNLKFSIRVTSTTSHVAAGSEVSSSTIATTFHKDAPTGCSCSLARLFTPADGAIYFYPDKVSGSVQASGAPLHSVYFVANKNAAASTTGSTSRSSNTIAATMPWGLTGDIVRGFDNAAAAAYTTPSYGAAVSIRDAAGIITDFASCTTCEVGGATAYPAITTRDIRGFLEGNNCFISSSAFGIDSVWTEGFRRFRDQVLLKTDLGVKLAETYYRWSPAGAAWLEGRAWARFMVAALLLPFSLLAWAWVTLGTSGMMGVLAILGIGGAAWRSRRS